MKILIVSSFLPYPLFSGGHVRLYNLIRELAKRHEIFLICEKREYQKKKDTLELEKFCKSVETIARKKQWSLGTIMQTGFSTYPFLMAGHTSSDMKQKIQGALSSEKFDIIHVETFYVFQNIPQTEIPIVLVEHNIEYLLYQRYINTKPTFLRPFLQLDIAKLKHWEEYFWTKANALVAVSEVEKNQMNKKDVFVVPNGVDTKKYQISNIKYQISKKTKKVLFIGDFRWIQNRDSIAWILKDIWPKISSQFTVHSPQFELKLWVVSRSIPSSIKDLTNDSNVIFDENAPEDTALIYQEAEILLAPIRIGGGTSFKILESMASGIPVVTTGLGAEGIAAQDLKEVLISEDAGGLATHVRNLLKNEKLYNKVVTNARNLIEEKYDWKIIVKKLEDVYDKVQPYVKVQP